MKPLRALLPYAVRQKRLILLGFTGSLFRFLIPLSVPLVVKYLLDDLLRNDAMSRADQASQLLLVTSIMLAVFFAVRAPMEYVRQTCMNKANNRIIADLRRDMFAKVHTLDAKYYANNRSGEIGTRLMDDTDKIRGYLTAMFSNVWIETIVLSAVVGIMLAMNATLALLSVLLVALQFALAHLLTKRVKALTREAMNDRSRLSGFVLETIQGAVWAKLFTAERREKERLERHLERYGRTQDRQANATAASLSVVNVLSDITPFLIVAAGSWFVIGDQLTLGSLIAFFAYVDRMRAPVAALVQAFPIVAEGSVALSRVFGFLSEPVVVQENENARKLERFSDAIAFERVGFSYDGRRDILNGVSFRLERGKTYAFVGESGGGKSTMLQLITRLYDANRGSVTIDGVDIRSYSLASLRSQLGVVTQEAFLYSGTIRDNIRLAKPDATDEEVEEAAKRAYAHAFIAALPEGYETEVGERGVKLSGGQKQRIALARVFLKNPPILLLDEATSALDNESEKLIQQSIERLRRGKTIVMIAHRLSTVVGADQIYVLRGGRIVESGDHHALLRAGGYYSELYREQYRTESAS